MHSPLWLVSLVVMQSWSAASDDIASLETEGHLTEQTIYFLDQPPTIPPYGGSTVAMEEGRTTEVVVATLPTSMKLPEDSYNQKDLKQYNMVKHNNNEEVRVIKSNNMTKELEDFKNGLKNKDQDKSKSTIHENIYKGQNGKIDRDTRGYKINEKGVKIMKDGWNSDASEEEPYKQTKDKLLDTRDISSLKQWDSNEDYIMNNKEDDQYKDNEHKHSYKEDDRYKDNEYKHGYKKDDRYKDYDHDGKYDSSEKDSYGNRNRNQYHKQDHSNKSSYEKDLKDDEHDWEEDPYKGREQKPGKYYRNDQQSQSGGTSRHKFIEDKDDSDWHKEHNKHNRHDYNRGRNDKNYKKDTKKYYSYTDEDSNEYISNSRRHQHHDKYDSHEQEPTIYKDHQENNSYEKHTHGNDRYVDIKEYNRRKDHRNQEDKSYHVDQPHHRGHHVHDNEDPYNTVHPYQRGNHRNNKEGFSHLTRHPYHKGHYKQDREEPIHHGHHPDPRGHHKHDKEDSTHHIGHPYLIGHHKHDGEEPYHHGHHPDPREHHKHDKEDSTHLTGHPYLMGHHKHDGEELYYHAHHHDHRGQHKHYYRKYLQKHYGQSHPWNKDYRDRGESPLAAINHKRPISTNDLITQHFTGGKTERELAIFFRDCTQFDKDYLFDGPVCASDNSTYSNYMHLACKNFWRPPYNRSLAMREGPCPHSPGHGRCSFSPIYKPVCGWDNKTYVNKEALACHNEKYRKSVRQKKSGCCQLQEPCRFTRYCWDEPVCGSNGITYQSLQALRCLASSDSSVRVLHEGPCTVEDVMSVVASREEVCRRARTLLNPAPICASDGNTYHSVEYFICYKPHLQVEFNSECGSRWHRACQAADRLERSGVVASPVCGSDGKTYTSRHHLHCASFLNRHIRILHEGRCKPVDSPCHRQQQDGPGQPVCGSDSVSYSSFNALSCVARTRSKSDLVFWHSGPCLNDNSACYTKETAVTNNAASYVNGMNRPVHSKRDSEM